MKRHAIFCLGAVLFVGTATAGSAAPIKYERPGRAQLASVSSEGAQGNDDSKGSAISRNGRYVVFACKASNLVPGDVNTRRDVFWHDRKTGVTRLAEVSSSGAQGIGPTDALSPAWFRSPRVSDDGRYVAFASDAINLVPGDTNQARDTFRHDMHTGQTIRVSTATGGAQGNIAANSENLSMSGDGRYIAFTSAANNLVPGDTNGVEDIFVRDVKTGTTVRASVSSQGTQANGVSNFPTITDNGRWLAFFSEASNLVPGVSGQQMYRRDLMTGKTIVVSVASDGSLPAFSPIPVCTLRQNILPVQLPSELSTLMSNLSGLRTFCYTTPSYYGPSISDDGRYVTFRSTATNLVPNDNNWQPSGADGEDVFVRDVVAARTERLSVTSSGQERRGQNAMSAPVISGDGRIVVYLNQNRRRSCSVLPDVLPDDVPDLSSQISVNCYDTLADSYDRLSGAMQVVTRTPEGQPVSHPACSKVGCGDSWGWNIPDSLSGDGSYLSFSSNAPDFATDDRNDHYDIIVSDRGRALGVGTLERGTEVASATARGPAAAVQPRLLSVRVVPRSELGDLFVRWDVGRLAPVSGVPAGGLLYGLGFTANGQRYEVRAQRVPGPDYDAEGGASFGLFRESLPSVWTKVATLKGGYGTVGDAVVTAVPLSLIGDGKAQLTDVTAYTAVGSYLSDATKILDSLRLSR